MLELLNNAALVYLHVVGLTSHASFFMQLQKFLIGFTYEDCVRNSILRLALFSNHGSVTRSIVLLGHKCVLLRSLNICPTHSSKFPPMRSM